MKKSLKIALGTTLGLGVFTTGLFSQQIYTKATTDWKTNAINNANSVLGQSGYSEKEKLKTAATNDINAKVQDEIGKNVEDQKAELQKLLDEYYQMKLNNMTSTPEFLSLQQQIKQIQASILARYEAEIDQVFAAQAQ